MAGDYGIVGRDPIHTDVWLRPYRAFTVTLDPTAIPRADAAPWRQAVSRTLDLRGPAPERSTVVPRI
ncbi:MAG: hypothetical protein M3541_17740 [Acidobacteriota bacterium]|nr:hypothetical protein [Acidobacteriota bacterium]